MLGQVETGSADWRAAGFPSHLKHAPIAFTDDRAGERTAVPSLLQEVAGMRCLSCGFESPPRAKFCADCGASLTGPSPARAPAQHDPLLNRQDETPPPVRSAAPEAERRQLTVMFCDLVGFTALSEQLDPEELRGIVQDYQAVCAAVVSRFEGHIAQYLGDGLLVYFGAPMAHEDDPQRAVRAGLGIVTELQRWNARSPRTMQVRVGIHTGLVVVGEVGGGAKRERLALGDTPNRAARIQGVAEPDTVVISSATHRLIEGYFACQPLGATALKGLSQPMELHRVLRESGAQSRFEVAVTTGLTPLVGRESEADSLLRKWEKVEQGEGQVVLLSAEAGIGKSRMVQVLKERALGTASTMFECRCSGYYQHSALRPLIDLLERMLEMSREDSSQEKLRKLENGLAQYPLSVEEEVPLLASLLSVPIPDRYPSLDLSPEQQKQKTLEVFLALLVNGAATRPVLFVMEDLQWIDPSTLEFLDLLIDQEPTAGILSVLTFRPEFRPAWTPRAHLSRLTLDRLGPQEVELMVEKLTKGRSLPGEVVEQIVTKTDGVPLFVEELTKMVLESGLVREADDHYELTGPLPPLAIPASLHDSLMARLDRLATVKEVAQLGATLGLEFRYELLQAVSPLDEKTLQQALTRLVDSELLYQLGQPPHTTYLFKHTLIQEAAYQSLLKSRRQQYHLQAAQALKERFPQTVETEPELLAYHYTEAGLIDEAIGYWQMAGERAIQRSANREAIAQLTTALELLETLPETAARARRELLLRVALGAPLVMTRGFGAPEVGEAYTRARELCRQVGEDPQFFTVLRGLWAFHVGRAEFQEARELGEQLLTLAQRAQDTALLVEAHRALGITLFDLGELTRARDNLEQAIVFYDPVRHRSHAYVYGQDPGVVCRSFAAWALWLLGYPDEALRRSHEALDLAQKLSHPHSLAFAHLFAAILHRCRRESQAAREQADAAIALCTEHRFALFLALATMLRGSALADLGQGEEGIAQLREGQAGYQPTGAQVLRTYGNGLLAEAHGATGQVEEGLNALAEALDVVDENGERFYEAELYRLKGEFMLRQSPPDERAAERCFRKAIDIARHQGAKSLELRAIMSLSRLSRHNAKHGEAQELLAELYGGFTEGLQTQDLKEAKAFLEDMS